MLFGYALVGLLMLATFWKVGDVDDPYSYPNMSGCIFMMLMEVLTGWMYTSVLKFVIERPVFLKETAD